MRYLLGVLLLWGTQSLAIVDIAPVEVGDKPGVSGHIAGSYASKSGNTEKDEYDLSGKAQYDSDADYITFIQGAYERTESGDIKTEDQKYAHARYLHKLNEETLYGELFLQYRENIFKGIDQRWLAGANLRWRFLSGAEWGKLYVGIGAFRESIDYTAAVVDGDESTTRMNSYLAYTHEVSDTTKFSMVGYYQPSFEDSDDEYASFIAELEVHVVKQLYLSFTYEVDYDSMPPVGVEKQDRMVKTSISWKF